MRAKFSQDVVPLADLKINPGKVVKHVNDSHRPVLLTSRGRGVAVVQDLEEYEKGEETIAFVKAIAQGLLDIKSGDTYSLDQTMQRLNIQP